MRWMWATSFSRGIAWGSGSNRPPWQNTKPRWLVRVDGNGGSNSDVIVTVVDNIVAFNESRILNHDVTLEDDAIGAWLGIWNGRSCDKRG